MTHNLYKRDDLKKDNPKDFLQDRFLEEKKKLYICSTSMFANVYYLEKEKAKRSNHNIFIIHFKFEIENQKETEMYYRNKIQDILSFSLRSSDLVSWLDDTQLVLLLIDLNDKEVKKIIKRIEINLLDYNILRNINMSIKIKITIPITME
ncbi:MAG: hypothetical protein ACOCRO_02410 [Halanaerobiales bacterium]